MTQAKKSIDLATQAPGSERPKRIIAKRRLGTGKTDAFEVIAESVEVPKGAKVILPKLSGGFELKTSDVKPIKLSWAQKRRRRIHSAEPNTPQPVVPEVDQSAFAPGARIRALLRGVERAQQDLREFGGALDLKQVRTLMRGVTRQNIEKRVREGGLLAVPGPSNRRCYPAIQFLDDGSIVHGLKELLAALPTRNGWAILNFLVRPDTRLGDKAPIDLLKAGEVALVVEAARGMGEQGA